MNISLTSDYKGHFHMLLIKMRFTIFLNDNLHFDTQKYRP